jgi:hypothetical protein
MAKIEHTNIFTVNLASLAPVWPDAAGTPLRLKRVRTGYWKMSLLNRASAATGILEKLTASGMDEGAGTDHPVHAAITYIRSHNANADRMN